MRSGTWNRSSAWKDALEAEISVCSFSSCGAGRKAGVFMKGQGAASESATVSKNAAASGSVTVEASLLLPFLIFIGFVFLCLALCQHDRCVLSACASQMAGKGALEKYQEEEELERRLERETWKEAEERLFLLRDLQVSAEVKSTYICILCTGESELLGGLEIKEEAEAKRMNPVTALRNMRRVKRMTEGQG